MSSDAAPVVFLPLIEQAKLAEQTERYEDMVTFMRDFTKSSPKLTDEQRNLLSVAYKNVVGSRRSAWRITSNIEQKAKEKEAHYKKTFSQFDADGSGAISTAELDGVLTSIGIKLSAKQLQEIKSDTVKSDTIKSDTVGSKSLNFDEFLNNLYRVKGDSPQLMAEYRAGIEKELNDKCDEILNLIDDFLLKNLPTVKIHEAEVFYYKMKGDYLRYLVEVTVGEKRTTLSDKANEAYKKASEVANAELKHTHPIRLGLALNYSVFHYEIMGQAEEACKLAKKAFDSAIAELDSLQEDSYKDSTLIMQLLRDNLTLWRSEHEHEQDQEREDPEDE